MGQNLEKQTTMNNKNKTLTRGEETHIEEKDRGLGDIEGRE